MTYTFTLKQFLQTAFARNVLVCTMILLTTAVNAAVTPTVTQSSTAAVTPGSTNQQIIRVQLTNGSGNPTNTVASMQFTMANTNNADVSAARLYMTTTTTFATTTQVGTTIVNPTGTITFGSLGIALNGNSTIRYFWLVFDIASTAVPCNTVDASVPINGIVITGTNASTLAATVQSPAGSRPINGTPTVTISTSSTTICAGATATFTASSNYNGSIPTYQWKLNGSNVSTASSYSTNALTNGNTVSLTVTYTAASCLTSNVVNSNTITMVVNPVPVVTATPTSQSICSGVATNVSLSSNIAGSTFAWTTTSSGSVSGFSNSNGNAIAQTLTNTGTAAATVTYTVIGTSPTGCTSSPVAVVITVKPTPNAVSTPSSQTLCSGASTSLALSSDVLGTTFSWTSVSSSPLLSGNSNTSGNNISDLLTNTDVAQQSIVYTITPTANSCNGNAISATVFVNPNLPTSVNIAANPAGAICAGTNVSFTATPVNGGTTPTFQWKLNGNNVGTNGAGFSTNALVDGDSVEVVMTSSYACPTGNPAVSNSITAIVNPIPDVVATPSSQNICSGNVTSIALSSSVIGTMFNWTANGSANINGYSNDSNDTIAQTLTNTNTTTGSVTYIITPSANGCTGAPINVVINVDPTLVTIEALVSDSDICDGTNVTFTALVGNGGTNTSYQWQLNGTDISGATNSTYSDNALVDGDSLNVVIVSDATCAVAVPISSNVISITVHGLPSAPTTTVNTPVCETEIVNFTADAFSAGTYNWTGPDGFTSAQQNPVLTNASVAANGIYNVVFTDSNGCVSASAQLALTVHALPAAIAGSNTAICNNGSTPSIGATAVDGNSYSWTSNPSGFASTNSFETVAPIVTTTYTLIETVDSTGCVDSNSVVITVNPLPNDNAGNDVTICDGTSTIIGTVAIAGHTYSWTSSPVGFTSSAANPSVNPGVTTTYYLTETISASGCSDTNAVVVNVNPVPSAIAGTNISICNGESANIGSAAVAGNSYSWTSTPVGFTSNVSNPAVSPTVTTTYALTETIDATGCFKSNVVVVTVNPLPIDHAGADVAICLNNNTTIGAASIAGRAYVWTSTPSGFTSTQPNPVVSPAITTTYSLTETIVATGCSSTNQVVITVNPLPAADAGVSQPICSGASVSIGAASVGGTTYAWSSIPAGFTSSLSSPTVTPTVTTTYTLTQTISATGCSKSNSIIITVNPLPAAAVGPNVSICNNGSTATIGASAVGGNTYSWSSNPAGFASTNASVVVSPTVTTTYALVETVTATGCSKSNSVVVTVNPLPAANAGTSSPICSGASKQLGAAAVAGRTYAWSSSPAGFTSSISNPTVSPTITTTYTLIETITATSCSASNFVVVTVNPLPAANAGTNTAICNNGASVNLGAANIAGTTYNWVSNPAGFTSSISNPVVTPTITTTYTLTQTITATGCAKSNSVVVTVNPLPVVNTGTSSAICLGQNKQLGAAAVAGRTYAWTSNPAGFNSTTANPTVSPTITTTYTLTVTITATGCNNTGSVIVTVNPVPLADVGGAILDTICQGTSVSLGSASVAGNTYSWSPAASLSSATVSNPTATPTITTTYALTETITATGCSKTNTVKVNVHTLQLSPTSNSPICEGDTADLHANANQASELPTQTNTNDFPIVSGTGNATYSPIVINGNPGVTINANTVNRVKFNIMHPQCNLLKIYLVAPNGSQIEMLDGQLPVPLPPGTTQIGNPTIKNGATNLINYDSPPWGNVYGPYESFAGLSGPVDGTWYIKIVQPTGVTYPTAELLSWTLTLNDLMGLNYNWTSTPSGFTSSAADPHATPTTTTTYHISVTNALNGCVATGSTVVTVIPAPVAPTLAAVATCSGQPAILTPTAPASATFVWYNVPTGGTPLATSGSFTTPALTAAATYYVQTQSSGSGCQSLARTAVPIAINPLPNAAVADTQETCDGIPVNIGAAAVAGSTYSWTSNPVGFTSNLSNPAATPSDTTIYTLTETISATGCSKSNSTVVFMKEIGTWVGLVSTEWDNEINWCGTIPTPTTNVAISSGCPFYPIIVGGVDATCRNIVITPGGTVDLTGGSLSVYGHFHPIIPTNYTQTGGTLILTGNLPQEVYTSTVKDAIVNNNAGVDLLGDVTVTGVLQLQNGLVNTDTNEVNVVNTAVAAISNHGITRYINGNLRRSVDSVGLYDFPVGTATKYELAQLDLHSLNNVSNILAKFNNTITGSAPNLTVNGTLINTLLNGGFWTLTPNQQPTSGTYDVILNERGHTNPALSQQAYTVLKRPNASSVWGHEGVTIGITQVAGGGTVTVPNYGLASFSDFAIGYGNAILPVELTVFNGWNNGDVNDLVWQTASESNSLYFELQRSADGQQFETIGTVAAAGYSLETLDYRFTDVAPLQGNNYYRLKAVDHDQTFEYSNVIVIATTQKQPTVHVYPNPASDVIHFQTSGTKESISQIEVRDAMGRLVRKQTNSQAGINTTSFDVSDLNSGLYFVRATEENGNVILETSFVKQ